MKEGYIPKADRKKILLLCDDLRMHSGVATMARSFVINTAHKYNWFQLGAALKHPDVGKQFDLSQDIGDRMNVPDASVFVKPSTGYGNAQEIRLLLKEQKPDAIFIFTDPRYWIWLFEIEREIRNKIPIVWLNIWDDYPAPMYNKVYYNSVDTLMSISKQTKNINELVLGEEASDKIIKYVPHGIDSSHFYPIGKEHENYNLLQEFKSTMFKGKDYKFIVFFNSSNIQRKHPADAIAAYQVFCDYIGKEAAKECAFVLHTSISDQHGTDLKAVKEAITDPEYVNIFFSNAKLETPQMNLLYNTSDLCLLPSSNEGWGLAITEAMMAGTMISANVTGGMQDQMRFENDKGEWINFDPDFPSNHLGTYKKCGEWAMPIFPSNRSLAGSPLTPYIFDDRCSIEDIAQSIKGVYDLGKEERDRRGLLGREWAMSDEAQMSAKAMADNISECLDETFDKFTPRPKYDIFKAGIVQPLKVQHKLTGY